MAAWSCAEDITMGAAEVDPRLANKVLGIFPIQPLTSKQVYTIIELDLAPHRARLYPKPFHGSAPA